MQIFSFFFNKDMPKLTTKSLILRRPYLTDVDDIFRCTGDPDISRYENWQVHENKVETLGFLNSLICKYDNNTCTDWVIERKRDKRAIGMINLHNIDEIEKSAEIGYWIAKDCWGNNYATESVTRLIKYAFKDLKLNSIYGLCHHQNKASMRVMEKSGLTYQNSENITFCKDSKLTEIYVYSILNRYI